MPSEQFEQVLQTQREYAASLANVGGIDEMRALDATAIAQWAGPPPADVHVEEVDAGGVPALSIVPPGVDESRVLIYLHGGGFVVGAAKSYVTPIARIARRAGIRAIAPDYRLAPENPWPAQVEDAVTTYRWVLDQGIDPAGVAIVGESAGGGLVVATLQSIRDQGLPTPAAAAPLSPMVDFEARGESWDTNRERDGFVTRDAVVSMVGIFLGEGDPSAESPINRDLGGLPPLLIQVGEREGIRDDGRAFAEKAKANGVDVTFEVWDSMIHLWHACSDLPEAGEALDRIGDFVRKHVS